ADSSIGQNMIVYQEESYSVRENFRYAPVAPAHDVLSRDHGDHGRGLIQALAGLGGSRHFHVQELHEVEVIDVVDGFCCGLLRFFCTRFRRSQECTTEQQTNDAGGSLFHFRKVVLFAATLNYGRLGLLERPPDETYCW